MDRVSQYWIVMAFSSHRLSERVSQLQNPGPRKRCTILPRQCGKEVISACHPKNRVQLKGRKKKYNTHGGKEKSANRVSGPQKKKQNPQKKSGMTCLEATVQFVSSHFRRGLPRLLFVASRGSEAKKRRCEKEEVWSWRLHLSS